MVNHAYSRPGDWLIFRPGLRCVLDTPNGRKMCLSPLAARERLLVNHAR